MMDGFNIHIKNQPWARSMPRQIDDETLLDLLGTPGPYSWIGVSSGTRGLGLNYAVNQDESSAELYIDRGKDADEENKAIFDQLFVAKDEIEKHLTNKPSWERLDGRRACRIRLSVKGGYRSAEDEWDAIQTKLVAAMNELDAALKPHLKKLKLGS